MRISEIQEKIEKARCLEEIKEVIGQRWPFPFMFNDVDERSKYVAELAEKLYNNNQDLTSYNCDQIFKSLTIYDAYFLSEIIFYKEPGIIVSNEEIFPEWNKREKIKNEFIKFLSDEFPDSKLSDDSFLPYECSSPYYRNEIVNAFANNGGWYTIDMLGSQATYKHNFLYRDLLFKLKLLEFLDRNHNIILKSDIKGQQLELDADDKISLAKEQLYYITISFKNDSALKSYMSCHGYLGESESSGRFCDIEVNKRYYKLNIIKMILELFALKSQIYDSEEPDSYIIYSWDNILSPLLPSYTETQLYNLLFKLAVIYGITTEIQSYKPFKENEKRRDRIRSYINEFNTWKREKENRIKKLEEELQPYNWR